MKNWELRIGNTEVGQMENKIRMGMEKPCTCERRRNMYNECVNKQNNGAAILHVYTCT